MSSLFVCGEAGVVDVLPDSAQHVLSDCYGDGVLSTLLELLHEALDGDSLYSLLPDNVLALGLE